jgi:uncharacterized protein
MTQHVFAVPLTPGSAEGAALVLSGPLSFWGGVDDDGTIVDVHHPQCGESVVDRVLVMPAGRGSSSSSSSLAELIRGGKGPRGIVLLRPDAIVALGAIVAAELYAIRVPVVHVAAADIAGLATDDRVELDAGDLEGSLRRL